MVRQATALTAPAVTAGQAITTQIIHPAPEVEPVMHDQGNDGKFPNESPVQVRYPRRKQ